MMRLRYVQALAPWLVTIVLFLVWELSCSLFSVPSFVLPRPSLVFKTMYQFRQQIEYHGLQTLFSTVVGFGLAIAVGLLIGIAVGASRIVYTSLYPLLIGFNSIPKVALVPVIVICSVSAQSRRSLPHSAPPSFRSRSTSRPVSRLSNRKRGMCCVLLVQVAGRSSPRWAFPGRHLIFSRRSRLQLRLRSSAPSFLKPWLQTGELGI